MSFTPVALQVPLATLYDALNSVGDYQESIVASGSAVALTSNTVANVTSMSLPAGDWNIFGVLGFLPAASTSITQVTGGSSSTSATLDAMGTSFNMTSAAVVPGAVGQELPLPTARVVLTVPTTIYLVARAVFSVSTMGAYGKLCARRAKL
jgi:hypothetical protein